MQLELRAIVLGEQREREQRLAVIVEIRGHVADAQFPLRLGPIRRLANLRGVRRRVALGPTTRLVQDRLRARTALEREQENQVPVNQIILWIELDRATVCRQAFVQPATEGQRGREPGMRRRKVRLQTQRLLRALHRIIETPELDQGRTAFVMRERALRGKLDRAIGRAK